MLVATVSDGYDNNNSNDDNYDDEDINNDDCLYDSVLLALIQA